MSSNYIDGLFRNLKIPSKWKIKKVQDVALEMKDAPFGSNLKSKDYCNEGVPVVQGRNIKENKFEWNNKLYVSEEKKNNLKNHICRKGDLVFPKVGTIGGCAILDIIENFSEFVLSTNMMKVSVDESKYSIRYIYYFFSNDYIKKTIQQFSASSVQPVFNFTALKNFEIVVPPLEDQKAIAETLFCLDEKIELNNRINKTLEEMAQTIFKNWFVDFEPFKDGEFEDSELGRIPKGWRVGTISDYVFEMKNGGTPSRKKEGYWSSHDFPWIKTGEICNDLIISSEEYISLEGLKNSSAKLLPKNTVLLAMYGATAGKVGLLRFEASTNQACCAMICENVNESIYLYLTLLDNQTYIESLAVGAAQQNLSKDTISKLRILYPNKEILNSLPFDEIFDAIECNLRQNQALAAIRDSLLPKLMSGEIRVPIEEV